MTGFFMKPDYEWWTIDWEWEAWVTNNPFGWPL